MAFLDEIGLGTLWSKITAAFVKKVDGKGLSTNDYTNEEKTKLKGIEEGANKYTHPSYTKKASGLYKVTVDDKGHVSAASAVTKTDITNLGIPSSNTTYSDFTGATETAAGKHGLVPAPAVGDAGKILGASGTWSEPELSYTEVDYESAAITFKIDGEVKAATIPVAGKNGQMGFMSPAMASKLNGLPDAATIESNYAKKTEIAGVYKYKGSLAGESKLPTSGQTLGDVYNLETESTYGPAGTNVAWDGKKWDALGGVLEIETITQAKIDEICV